jgi:hypothetical protein
MIREPFPTWLGGSPTQTGRPGYTIGRKASPVLPGDFIMPDEAHDTNPVLEAIFLAQDVQGDRGRRSPVGITQVRLANVEPGDRPPDQHPLDLRGALEDGEDPGDRGSLCRSAACSTPWYQHGFSTPGPRRIPVLGRPRARLACGAQTRFSGRTTAASKLEDALGGLLRNGYIAGSRPRPR